MEEIKKLFCTPWQRNGSELHRLFALSDVFRGSVIAECRLYLYETWRHSVLTAGGALDYEVSRVYNAVRCTSAGSVWFTRCVRSNASERFMIETGLYFIFHCEIITTA